MSKQLKISILDSPCHNCSERRPGCHSECDRYISFRKNEDALKEKDRIERISNYTEPWSRKQRKKT